jgi:solute carrier family 35, member C2
MTLMKPKYLFSLSISLYTWMFSSKHLDFPFPLFTTSMHMLVQFALASLVLYFLPSFRPRHNSISNEHNIYNTDADRARQMTEEKRSLMTKWFYFTRLGPCGMATGLDIGLGNTSLKFISLSFYSKSTASCHVRNIFLDIILNLTLPAMCKFKQRNTQFSLDAKSK